MMSLTSASADRPRTILLVDDELNQVTILKAGLAKLTNCQVSVATSGRQALKLCAEQAFDLIITDYHMPGMDGLTLATAVHQQYPATAIIMLTAFGSEVVYQQTEDNPIQLVLEKPIDIMSVRSAAVEILNHAHAPADPK